MTDAICQHRNCGMPYSEHVPRRGGRRCPDGSGLAFCGHRDRVAAGASQSFSADEVELLDAVVDAARGSGDGRKLVREPAFASLARKVLAMRRTAERRAAERARRGRVG